MVKIDLHNHLGRNGANPGFDRTIDIAYKRLGPGGIFGICNDGPTDYRYQGFINQAGGKYERVIVGDKNEKRAIYVPDKKITVVGVEEAEPREGSFICIGMPVNKKICYSELEDSLKVAEDLDTTRIIVHPFFRDGMGAYVSKNPELLHRFHAWEIYNASAQLGQILPQNSQVPPGANSNAFNFYKDTIEGNYNLGIVSFTDGHSVNVIGTSYTEIEINPQIASTSFFNSLREQIQRNKTFYNLNREPAKGDAFKHASHMIIDKFFKTGA